MDCKFFKYQGTGNDFIVFDDRKRLFPSDDRALIAKLCHRKRGIGSDGILLIQESTEADLHVDFLNPDGSRSFCGNGSRCAIRFAEQLGMVKDACTFMASDGLHQARIHPDRVEISMRDVTEVIHREEDLELYTGSPHLIKRVKSVASLDVQSIGSAIRYNERYKQEGININFIELTDRDSELHIRTYERGVEGETLSCGTGVTAAVLSEAYRNGLSSGETTVHSRGGVLSVRFKKIDGQFTDVWLSGPAVMVFSGEVDV